MPEPGRTNNDVVSGLAHEGHAATAHQAGRAQPRREAAARPACRLGLGGHRPYGHEADPGRHPSGELHRGRDAAGAARAAQVHQPLARRRSGRGGRQAAYRELPEHRFAGEQQAPVPAPAGEHQRQREPSQRREEPDRPLRGLCDPRQQPLHRGLPVQGPRPRHRAPHHPRCRAVPQRPASGRDRVQIAQGKGRYSRGDRSASPLQRAAQGQRGKGMRRSSTTTSS